MLVQTVREGHLLLYQISGFGKSLSETNLKAEEIVEELDQWFLANKLSLSIDKTCYSIFGCHDVISKHA